jgi:phosphatidylglycerophosphate synthase
MPLLVFFLFTEIINVLASLYYKSKGINIGSNIYGKTKMVLLSLVFVAILVTWPKPPSLFFIYVIWLSLFFSYLSIFTKLLEPNDKKYAKLKNP